MVLRKVEEIEYEEFLKTMLLVKSSISNNSQESLNDLKKLIEEYTNIKFNSKKRASVDDTEKLKSMKLFKNVGENFIKVSPNKTKEFTEEFQNLSPKELIDLMSKNNAG